ncbi:hypothetical protein M436DRAFT_67979 [Aureobasidium namibiae CBS 147.97]|uniref:Zn(2)-C6 fungal-type domain-containing protein n=1 Tax=Aureobasidium namibiae CBS 147.97 TaxID=1043004 RepID=A0A074W6C7_9PEZI
MVNAGRSHACITCKRRKIKCDETKPTCSRCIKASLHCIWVKPVKAPDIRFVDMTQTVAAHHVGAELQRKLRVATAPPKPLVVDRETQAVNFFHRHYMIDPKQDGAPNAGLFGLFMPAFSTESQDSSAAMAVSALAMSVYSRWRMGGMTEKRVAKVLGQAIWKLSNDIQVEDKRKNDITLLATLTLQFHSSFESLFDSSKATIVHHLGALALVRGFGPPESWSHLANQFVAYILHVEVAAAIREHRRVNAELCYWSSAINPASMEADIQFDILGIRVADVQFRADCILGTPEINSDLALPSPALTTLLSDIQELDACLVLWEDRVSQSWGPYSWTSQEVASPPIQTFEGACHVYTSIRSARLINIWRSYRLTLSLLALQLINRHGERSILDGNQSETTKDMLAKRIQWLIDGFCASVPFFLGNRTKIGTVLDFDDPSCKFPTCHDARELNDMRHRKADLKGLEASADHASHAIAQGVWLIMGNLTQLVAFFLFTAGLTSELSLRTGQLSWICQQYLRNLSLLSLDWTTDRGLEQKVLTGIGLPPEEVLISEARRCVERVMQGLRMVGD